MFNESVGQKVKVILFNFIFGIGIGGLISLVLVMTKKIPDKFGPIMTVALPIGLVYVIYKAFKNFNKIEITNQMITISNLFGKKQTFDRSGLNVQLELGSYSINYAKFAPILTIYLQEENTKVKKYNLAGYNEKNIEAIAGYLDITFEEK